MKKFWNERYAEEGYAYGIHPNEFFSTRIGGLPPGSLLLPAEGEGRNAVYAAKLGWEVHAFDYSEAARKKAMKLARQSGVELDYRLAAYEEVEWPLHSFDCLALIFAHVPKEKRQEYHRKLVRYLKPGGTLILEGFSKAQIGRDSGGPKDPDMLFSKAELASDFRELAALLIEEAEVELDEGPFHRGKAMVIRLEGKA